MTSAAFDLYDTFSPGVEPAPMVARSASALEFFVERLFRTDRVSKELLAKVDELQARTGARGWDDERGEPVLPAQWDQARQLLRQCDFAASNLPPPFLSACGDGSAHLQWTTQSGDRAVIEFGARSITWNFLGADGEDEILEDLSSTEALTKVRNLFGVR
jgi:hypothetical protein